ncbi:hypothetical protein F4821DRAFT_96218 [Hypoxylon rubiginosum]|uniref:Uncharacterized protein n=1 Tax=Hypoxylon rubiginosum TaxID=110542 RepID=A0ACC0D5Y6_9PEZI|nr:hypothetical protein F4821DRAFT_96218 [Hypoxylon rubiginosum]
MSEIYNGILIRAATIFSSPNMMLVAAMWINILATAAGALLLVAVKVPLVASKICLVDTMLLMVIALLHLVANLLIAAANFQLTPRPVSRPTPRNSICRKNSWLPQKRLRHKLAEMHPLIYLLLERPHDCHPSGSPVASATVNCPATLTPPRCALRIGYGPRGDGFRLFDVSYMNLIFFLL